MDNSLKGLMLAAGVIITCVVIALGFYISRESRNASNSAGSMIAGMNEEYQDADKTLYEGMQVSGREVLEAIDKLSTELDANSFQIVVYTGKASGGITLNKKEFDKAALQKKGDNDYINPNGLFQGEIIRDDNGTVSKLIFRQS